MVAVEPLGMKHVMLRIRCADAACSLLVPAACSQYRRRYAILDGREPDLDMKLPVSLVPVISKVCC